MRGATIGSIDPEVSSVPRLKRAPEGPVQRGYLQADWDKALGALTHPTEEDRRLHLAARFFGDQLAGIRQRLRAAPPPSGSLSSLIRRAIGFVNRETLTAEREALKALPTVASWADELIQTRIEMAGGLNTATLDQVVEGVVDGLRFELSSLLEHPTSARAPLSDGEELQRIVLRANLSTFYHILEEEWLDCLHHGWAVQKSASGALIAPTDNFSAIDWTISQHRAQVLDHEIGQRSVYMLRDLDDSFLAQSLGITIQSSGKRQEYAVGRINSDLAVQVYGARMLAADPDLEPFATIRLNTGLTSVEMLHVWSALAPLAHDLSGRTPSEERIVRVGQLEEFAPSQDELGLLSALQRSTGLSRKLCTAALEQLIWRDSHDSLWHRPFVRLKEPKRLFLVVPALKYPNLRRSVEYWFSEGGGDLSERGEQYEKYVRKEIAHGIAVNRLLQKRAGALLEELEPPDTSVGDLDLVFWIGNSAVVGEVKCLLRPATSHDWFKYEARISEAVQQVSRKASYARENLDWFRSKLEAAGAKVGPVLNILPCVVLNSPMGSLRLVDGVPIVDVYVLSRYVEEGFAIMYASLADETTGERVKFYENAQEAEERLETFLRDPLHLRPYKDSIKWEVRVQPDFEQDSGVVLYKFPVVEVNLPKPSWAGPKGKIVPD